jgi:hypothetical protein
MDKTKIEVPAETSDERTESALRTLQDLELLLVGGGGDDTPAW